jgi:hypothetical protein
LARFTWTTIWSGSGLRRQTSKEHRARDGVGPHRAPTGLHYKETTMLKFIGGTIGIIFLIGLAVVVGLLMLIF